MIKNNTLWLIDNYDSFVHNIARYFSRLGCHCEVMRNDAIDFERLEDAPPNHIVISPGPCAPDQAGQTLALIEKTYRNIPILGVCLGHQALGQFFGAKIQRAKKPLHGKATLITHDANPLFFKIPSPMKVGRYHSLIVDEAHLSDDCQVIARSLEGEIMALAHRKYPIYGVQFHPESILTELGEQVLQNFIAHANIPSKQTPTNSWTHAAHHLQSKPVS